MAGEISELELENMTLSGDLKLDEQIRNWLKWDGNSKTKAEISQAVKNKDWDA